MTLLLKVTGNILVPVTTVLVILLLTACSKNTASTPLSEKEQLLQTGSQKARMCVGCHGPKGISRLVSYPSLAGKPEEYLSRQLHAFRSGERVNPMMSSIAKNIAEEDIAALSFYFASLPGPNVETEEQAAEHQQ